MLSLQQYDKIVNGDHSWNWPWYNQLLKITIINLIGHLHSTNIISLSRFTIIYTSPTTKEKKKQT